MLRKCLQLATDGRLGRNSLCAALRGELGNELLEGALVLPLLFSLMLGIFWMARAYNVYQTITRAAREGTRLAVTRTCATCGNTLPTNSAVRTAVTDALTAASLDSTKATNTFGSSSCPSGQTCDCPANDICIIRDVPLNTTTGGPQEIGVSISFGYPVQFPIPFVSLSSVTINTQVQMREEN